MKKLVTIVTSFVFTVLLGANVFAAGDDANIQKLSSFKKTGTAAGEVIPRHQGSSQSTPTRRIRAGAQGAFQCSSGPYVRYGRDEVL